MQGFRARDGAPGAGGRAGDPSPGKCEEKHGRPLKRQLAGFGVALAKLPDTGADDRGRRRNAGNKGGRQGGQGAENDRIAKRVDHKVGNPRRKGADYQAARRGRLQDISKANPEKAPKALRVRHRLRAVFGSIPGIGS